MRKVEFEVPEQVIGDFIEKLQETGLDNRVLGRNGEEIEIEVLYTKENADLVDELEEYLEELREGLESEDEDEDK